MTLQFYRMKAGQEEQVARLVRHSAVEFGSKVKPAITEQILKENAHLLRIEIADMQGSVVGFCAWARSFSTWRGQRGMFITDHYIRKENWTPDNAKALLKLAAKNARLEGIKFVRLEVDASHRAAADLFKQVGFWSEPRLVLHYLEDREMGQLAGVEAEKLQRIAGIR